MRDGGGEIKGRKKRNDHCRKSLAHNLEIEKKNTSPRGPCNRASPWYVHGIAGEPLIDASA